MKNLLFLSVLIFITLFHINGKIKVDPQTRFFVDEFGRKRLYIFIILNLAFTNKVI